MVIKAMSQADILAAVKGTQPFVPLQLVMSNGERINITHPDAVLVSKTNTAVALDGVIHLIANLHIVRIAPLEMSIAS
jgi:hypothetical protein